MNIYVGNLSYDATEEELRDAFSQFGAIDSVKIIKDRETGASRGFGFVEISPDQDAEAAIQQLNGAELKGRNLVVNQAKDRAGSRGKNNRSSHRGDSWNY